MKTSRIRLSVWAASVVMAAGLTFPTGARAQSGSDAFSSQGDGIRAQAIQDAFSIVSVAPDGTTPGNGYSADASISGDGRFVAFASRATNLVASDTNDSSDIFVRDRQTNTTTRVSVTTAGEQRQGDSVLPRITPDGRFVVFQSSAAFVADDTCAQAAELCRDIYLHDRNTSTTTRMSITALGSPANGPSYNASISADGRYVVFLSEATNLVPVDSNLQTDVFMRDRQLGVTTRVSTDALGNQTLFSHSDPRLSGDGRFLLYTQYRAVTPCTTVNCGVLVLRDLQAGTFTDLVNLVPPPSGDVVYASVVNGISDDGRIVVIREKGPAQPGNPFIYERDVILDRQNERVRDTPTGGPIPAYTQPSALSGDGRLASYGVAGFHDRITDQREGLPLYVVNLGRPGPLSLSTSGRFAALSAPKDASIDQIWVYDRDTDNDGMPWVWETVYRLDPFDASDAALDPDGDGLTNAQEFANNSHPKGTFTRYFAEGAANAFFSTRFALLNPNDAEARVTLRFLGQDGQVTSVMRALRATSRTTVDIGPTGPVSSNSFSTIVESDSPVVADRTMTWDATGYGGHTETALVSPSTTWHFAEGATHGQFDLFYLLQNPTSSPANVTIDYLRLAPLTPIVKTYDVPANGRKTIYVDEEGDGLAAVDLAAAITSDVPIVAERAMYWVGDPAPWTESHDSLGVAAPGTKWVLAEGRVGGPQAHQTYILLGNPSTTTADVTITYLRTDGTTTTSHHLVPGTSRLNVHVNSEVPMLLNEAFGAKIEVANGVGIVVEKSTYWNAGGVVWAAGTSVTGTRLP